MQADNLYINDTPQTIGVNLGLFVDDTCLYATERKEVIRLEKSPAWPKFHVGLV
jgi:hypothetical protein